MLHTTRYDVLRCLYEGAQTVASLRRALSLGHRRVWGLLKELEEDDWVTSHKDQKHKVYHLNRPGMEQLESTSFDILRPENRAALPRCLKQHPNKEMFCEKVIGHTGPCVSWAKTGEWHEGDDIEWWAGRPETGYRGAPGSLPKNRSSHTGLFCDACGSHQVIRTGTCLTCLDCGTNGGCG